MILPYLEGEEIATQTPQTRLATYPSVRFLTEGVYDIAWLPHRSPPPTGPKTKKGRAL
jgi:hypothetical protein